MGGAGEGPGELGGFTRLLARDRDDPMPAVRWRVFDEAGRWLAELHTPEGFELRKVQGGLLLGVTRNSYGVEEVRGYRLEAGVG